MQRSEIAARKVGISQPAVVSSAATLAAPGSPAIASAADVEALYFLGPEIQDNIAFDFEPLSPQFLTGIDDSGRSRSLPALHSRRHARGYGARQTAEGRCAARPARRRHEARHLPSREQRGEYFLALPLEDVAN